jgi:hypothetical protein
LALTRVLLSSYAADATSPRLAEAWELLTDVLNEETLRPPDDAELVCLYLFLHHLADIIHSLDISFFVTL